MAKHAANNGNGENESRENQFSRQNRSPGNQSISDDSSQTWISSICMKITTLSVHREKRLYNTWK